MKRKLTAVLLSALIIFSCFIPAFASEDSATTTVISPDKLEYVLAAVISEFIGVDDDATVIIDEMPNNLDKNNDGNVTAKEASANLARYLFVDYDTVESISSEIAENSVYTLRVLDDGNETLYIAVDIIAYPEILNFNVFRSTVDKLYATQETKYGELGTEGASYTLLSYYHIAGELAVHTILYVVADTFGGSSEDSSIHSYYNRLKVADLNIDEPNVPDSVFRIFGWFLMDFLFTTVYEIFR